MIRWDSELFIYVEKMDKPELEAFLKIMDVEKMRHEDDIKIIDESITIARKRIEELDRVS